MAEASTSDPLDQSQPSQSDPKKSLKPQAVFEHSGRSAKRMRFNTPPPMTAAAAHAEERRQKSPAATSKQSPNPQAEAIGTLLGVSQNATSPATTRSDPATTMSQGLSTVADHLQGPAERETGHGDDNTQISPVTSVGSTGTAMGPSGSGTAVASPQPIDGAPRLNNDSASPHDSSKAMSYPNPFLQPQSNQPSRGMSLPGSSTRQDTRSPSSNKKHRCPYCSTEFTRHHNLKSHLLTHSQEKPYVCSTCQSRFRRLHDLKRHTKLHTGERPHVCPKCNRKFARGDALARHNKGPGGCAGRRASMGSFAGDEDMEGDEGMEGVVYNEPDAIEDEDGALRGTPQIRRQAPSGDDSIDSSANYRMPSTYPPIQGRPPGSFPPPGYNSSSSSHQYSGGSGSSLRPGSQVFAQNPMTESPKPMSSSQRQGTGTMDSMGRNRSPSNAQYVQPYPPRGSSGSSSLALPPHPPQLPPPHNLNPPDPRFTLPSQAGPTHPPTGPSGPPGLVGSGPLSSHSNSSSHGFSAHGSGEGSKGGFPTNEERLWAVVRSLEQQVSNMQGTIEALRAEVSGLRQAQQAQQAAT